ncbi:MAG: single-stranded DNA-binding protein [Candidatus Nanopelagicales bacterium]|nr:single-stranded DNA-binding protein [Candidatus Nanopelagicales bacterium]
MSHDTFTGANDVHLIGRLGQQVAIRELPSGDEITTFTVVVPRGAGAREHGPSVDSLACQTMRAAIRSKVERWEPGTWVEVHGALRRRFWNSGRGLASATEIDVRTIVRVRESSGVVRPEHERGARR